MTFNRWTITIVVVLCAMAISYALFVETQAEAPVAVPMEFEADLIALDRRAIENAYQQQMMALFQSWMKDATGQPERATRGANIARKAYVASMLAIDERIRKQNGQR